MSAVPKRKLTEAEYLAIERDAEFKSEFYEGQMFAMAGVSRQHNRLQSNLGTEFGMRLKGTDCHPFTSDMRVKITASGLYTYPDFGIVFGQAHYEKIQGVDTLLNPRVVFEVLSETTERWDRDLKFQNYKLMPSLREYILLSQVRVQVEHRFRLEDDEWDRVTTFLASDELQLKSVDVRVPLADIYRGVEPLESPPS